MKFNPKKVAFIGVMAALGNLLGFIPLKIPSPSPAVSIELHFSQLPPLFIAFSLGPLSGALTGLLSLIAVTAFYIKNPLVPFGNMILAGVAGLAAKKFKPIIAGLIGEVVETPFLWFSILFWSGIILQVPFKILIPIITLINIKAFIEVFISSFIASLLLRRKEIKSFLKLVK
ncbi:MAG: ECF transporter S component [Candidatus Bathyarchaeia archaeon]